MVVNITFAREFLATDAEAAEVVLAWVGRLPGSGALGGALLGVALVVPWHSLGEALVECGRVCALLTLCAGARAVCRNVGVFMLCVGVLIFCAA